MDRNCTSRNTTGRGPGDTLAGREGVRRDLGGLPGKARADLICQAGLAEGALCASLRAGQQGAGRPRNAALREDRLREASR